MLTKPTTNELTRLRQLTNCLGPSEADRDLESLLLRTSDGDVVPVSSLARIVLTAGPEQINHRERQRAVTIEVKPPPEIALEDALDQIDEKIVQPLIARYIPRHPGKGIRPGQGLVAAGS